MRGSIPFWRGWNIWWETWGTSGRGSAYPQKKSCGVWVGFVTTPKALWESYSSSHTDLQLVNGVISFKSFGNLQRTFPAIMGGRVAAAIFWSQLEYKIWWKLSWFQLVGRFVYPQICIPSILKISRFLGFGFHNIILTAGIERRSLGGPGGSDFGGGNFLGSVMCFLVWGLRAIDFHQIST